MAMAVVPDPQKLLLPDPDHVPSFWTGKFFTTFSSCIAFGGACAHRLAARQPIFSGFPLHVGATAVAFGLATVLQNWYDERNIEKDAIYRHYISIHPEEFPMPERKKVGEVFPEFVPIR